MNPQGIAILGSTGSIGCSTLRVIESLGNQFEVIALGAGRNIAKLAEQIARHRPEVVSVKTEECAEELRVELRRCGGILRAPRIVTGETGLVEVATHSGCRRFCADIEGA